MGKGRSPAFHVAWAVVVLGILVAGTVLALRGMTLVDDSLAPRIETVLRTNLAVLAGRQEAFLVAHTQGGHLDATSDQTLKTVLGIPLGTTRARVEWDFTVDLGIDLRNMDPGAFEVRCDEDGDVCRWHVPDPTSRTPAIRTETMIVTVDGAALLSSRVEDKNAQALVSRVTDLTENNVRSEAFWSTARENVRSSLADFAEEHLLEAAPETKDDPPTIEVVFASEPRAEEPPGAAPSP